jgi:hypothetical protein
MAYRTYDETTAATLRSLQEAEVEILRLQEENKRLLELLVTETNMPMIEKDPEIPELLNAGLLYEPNPLKRAYYAIKCAVWECDWVVTVDLEKAERIYLGRARLIEGCYMEGRYVDEAIYYWCKVQCRHCKRIGKDSKTHDSGGIGIAAYSSTFKKARELESYFEKKHSKLKKDGKTKP